MADSYLLMAKSSALLELMSPWLLADGDHGDVGDDD